MGKLSRLVTRGLTEASWLAQGGRPTPGLRVLLYHAVGTKLDLGVDGLSIEPWLFREHMRCLVNLGVDLVALEPSALTHSVDGKLRVAVTFDDGYRDNLTAAAPILSDMGIPFTVFAVPKYVQQGHPVYMTKAELKELASVAGCRIGSHGMNHRPMAKLPPEELAAELSDSRKWLADAIGRPVDTVSYPNGSASAAVAEAARRAGYALGSCSRTAANPATRDPFMLCRTEILGSDGVRAFKQKLYGAWDWHRWRYRDPALLS